MKSTTSEVMQLENAITNLKLTHQSHVDKLQEELHFKNKIASRKDKEIRNLQETLVNQKEEMNGFKTANLYWEY